MKRVLILAYGVGCYAIGLGSLVYMMGWLGNLVVPNSIDAPRNVPILLAATVNAALFVLFAVQHSVMARPIFKQWLARFLPESVERSTFILCSGVALSLLMWLWQPLGITIWEFTHPVAIRTAWVLYGLGWAVLVGSTFALNHYDLFGLRQVWLQFRQRPYTHLPFATPGPYRLVRHPIYVGWIVLAWATPTMSLTHFAFAACTTWYILMAIPLEERDLRTFHPRDYPEYQRSTPMLIPRLSGDRSQSAAGA